MGRKSIDETRQRYGKLTVVKEAGKIGTQILWECVCDCGNKVNVRVSNLRSGGTKSCGCLRKENCGQKRRPPSLQKERYRKKIALRLPRKRECEKIALNLLQEGMTYKEISEEFNRIGIPTLTQKTTTWEPCHVKYLLRDRLWVRSSSLKTGPKENSQKEEYKKLAQILRSQGMTHKEISEQFNRQGVPTLSGKTSVKWSGGSVRWLLRD